MTVAARTAEQAPPLALEHFEDERPALGLDQLDDDHLARAVRHEGERAFEILYERLNRPVYGYCCSILGDGGEAEEALQETMFRAYATLRKGQAQLRIKPWLYTVARNACIDRIRQRRPLPLELDEEQHDLLSPSAADSYDQRERLTTLVRDMGELSERQRSALILREMSGLSLIEIGDTLATTPDRAKALISEARRSLRRSSVALQAAVPVLPAAKSQAILANVLSSAGAKAGAGAGAGSLLAAAGAKKLAVVATVLAIGAGSAGVAVRVHSAQGPSVAAGSTSLPAAAAAAAVARVELASAVAAEPEGPGAAGGIGLAGGGPNGTGGGSGVGSTGNDATGPGSTGTGNPPGDSVTGGGQNTVNDLLGSAQQTVDQVGGTVNDTLQGVTDQATGKVKGVTDGIGVKVPDVKGQTGDVLGR